MGDLANGRTVRSLASMLTSFDNVSFYFIALDVVKMGDDIKVGEQLGIYMEVHGRFTEVERGLFPGIKGV